MPRPRRTARGRRANLSPGAVAFFLGEPMPTQPGPDQDDYVGLTYFGNVVRGHRRSVSLEQLREEFEEWKSQEI